MGLTFTWKRHHERHMHHPAFFNPFPSAGICMAALSAVATGTARRP